uniref:Uncharacterized protein n=1 Tax=Glossina morsitans morsitans TaxID=37546 RepID=A0A1B0FC81_GLOMM
MNRMNAAASTTAATTTTTTPTFSALLTESRNLLLKQQLRLQLNLNVNDMMNSYQVTNKRQQQQRRRDVHESDICFDINKRSVVRAERNDDGPDADDVVRNASTVFKRHVEVLNKLDTVTTVPKLQQQQLNKFNIKTTETDTTSIVAQTNNITSVEPSVTTSTITATTYSSLIHSSNTALAKFNRIIDNTMPATNIYYQQQAAADTVVNAQQQQQQQQMPFLSDSLRRRLAQQYPDMIANSSKINLSATTLPTTTSLTTTSAAAVAAAADELQLKRNDVHYLLKQLNSFSDIEEIEIVDMKQKQRQQQLLNKQQQKQQEQPGDLGTHVAEHEPLIQQICKDIYRQDLLAAPLTQLHVSGERMQPSPTTTSLVLYSPSSQSHKGIRRYASLHQQDEFPHHHHHHHDYHHHHLHHHHSSANRTHPSSFCQLPHEHSADSCICTMRTDTQMLQQFVDDYIFQSCHYLETNNFAANYRTAMVESSSHEFRPSTTTTTRTSTTNGEGYDEDGGLAGAYNEDASSAQSFELHETEPPSVICKAPAPCSPVYPQRKQYTMETRLCSSGVQTDLTASSLAQSSSMSSSTTSSERRARRKPLFKCCYTPLDRWREKRSNATTIAISSSSSPTTQKRTKTAPSPTVIDTSVAVVGASSKGAGAATSVMTTMAAVTTATTITTTAFVHAKNHGHAV